MRTDGRFRVCYDMKACRMELVSYFGLTRIWSFDTPLPSGNRTADPCRLSGLTRFVGISERFRRCSAPETRSRRSEPHGQAFGAVTRVLRSWSRAQDAAAIATWSADAPIETNDMRCNKSCQKVGNPDAVTPD